MSVKRKIVIGLVIILCAVVALPILAVVGLVVSFSVQSSMKMNDLRKAADQRASDLSGITLVTGQKTVAKPIVEGDGLTANSDAGRSTYATASFTLDRTLGVVRNEVEGNLGRINYKPMTDADGVLYRTDNQTGNDGVTRTLIEIYYKKDSNNTLKLTYLFDKEYGCPEGYICNNNIKDSPTTLKRYQPAPFEALPVTKLDVSLQAERGPYLAL